MNERRGNGGCSSLVDGVSDTAEIASVLATGITDLLGNREGRVGR